MDSLRSNREESICRLDPREHLQLQLLFYEQCCVGRGFNVYGDGVLIAEMLPLEQNFKAGLTNRCRGCHLRRAGHTAEKLVIVLTVNGRTREDLTDPNAILNGLTLEVLKEVAPPARPTLSLTKAANGTLTITTDSTLQVGDVVTGPFTSLPDKSITVDPTTRPQKFYRSTR